MDSYNVKEIIYPDLSKQVRLYHKPIVSLSKDVDRPVMEFEPFTYNRVRSVKDMDEVERSKEVSRRRSLDKIYQYARSNIWEYFVTFTFAPDVVDRYDYDSVCKKLSVWLNNMRKLSPALSYLIVPERHKDGAYHFHGLFSGVEGLDVRWSGKYVCKRFKAIDGKSRFKVCKDRKIWLFGKWKFGWMSATEVMSNERVTKYITKYVTKDLADNTFGKKRYWASRNLLLPYIETSYVDQTDKFIIASELGEIASYQKELVCDNYSCQHISVFELK